MQGLILKTAATSRAISIADAKTWLRTELDDAIVDSLIRAATEELRRKKQIVPLTEVWTLYLDWFYHDRIELPLRPVLSVASIKYYDSIGVLTTLPTTDYQVDAKKFVARVSPAPYLSWPTTQDGRDNAIEIEFSVGFGAVTQTVPETIKNAIKCQVSHLYYGDPAMGKAAEILAGNEAVVHV